MKCMSFNIQHGRHFTEGVIDLAHMAKTIADENADLVVLNEVYGKGEGKDFVGQAEEIAKILGQRPGTVRSHLSRARETLRRVLKGDVEL